MPSKLSRLRWVGFLLLWVALNPVSANAEDTQPSLIVSIKSGKLFKRLGLSCEVTEPTALWQAYDVGDSVGGIRVSQVGVALFPSEHLAEQGIQRRIQSTMTTAPREVPRSVGDECMAWASDRGGTFFFRRTNLVVTFTWQGSFSRALVFAEKADGIFARDEEVAPRGRATPETNEFGFIPPDDTGLTDVIRRPLYMPSGYSPPGHVPAGDHSTPTHAPEKEQPGTPSPEVLTRRTGSSVETADPALAESTPKGSQVPVPEGVAGAGSDLPREKSAEESSAVLALESPPETSSGGLATVSKQFSEARQTTDTHTSPPWPYVAFGFAGAAIIGVVGVWLILRRKAT